MGVLPLVNVLCIAYLIGAANLGHQQQLDKLVRCFSEGPDNN